MFGVCGCGSVEEVVGPVAQRCMHFMHEEVLLERLGVEKGTIMGNGRRLV